MTTHRACQVYKSAGLCTCKACRNCVESNDILLGFVSEKFGQSIKSSLLSSEVVVTEVDEDFIPRFDTEEEKN